MEKGKVDSLPFEANILFRLTALDILSCLRNSGNNGMKQLE